MAPETNNQAEIDHLVSETPEGEAPPPYELHQTHAVVLQGPAVVGEAATLPTAGTDRPVWAVPAVIARFFAGWDREKCRKVGHTIVAIFLIITTVMVTLAANDKVDKEKDSLYESMAMNSVAFTMIYLSSRLPTDRASSCYNFSRMAEIMCITVSVFLFIISTLTYGNIVSTTCYTLILGIVFLGSAIIIEIIVLIVFIYLSYRENFTPDRNRNNTRR